MEFNLNKIFLLIFTLTITSCEKNNHKHLLSSDLDQIVKKIVNNYSQYLEADNGQNSHKINIYSLRFFQEQEECYIYIGTDTNYDSELDGFMIYEDNLITFSNTNSKCNNGLIKVNENSNLKVPVDFKSDVDRTDNYSSVYWVFKLKNNSLLLESQGRHKINF